MVSMNNVRYMHTVVFMFIINTIGDINAKESVMYVTPSIESLNVITMKPVSTIPPLTKSIEIDDLVAHINHGNTPPHAIIANGPGAPTQHIEMRSGVTNTKQDPVVVVFSRGFARTNTIGKNENFLRKGGCAVAAFWPIRDGVIPTHVPCVVFDYPDERKMLNLGQEMDQACLEFVITHVLKNNPDVKIVLMGDCRGAKAALAYAVKYPNNVQCMVLFSPFVSVKDLVTQIARSYVFWLPKSRSLLYKLFKTCLPNYDDDADTQYDNLPLINPNLPIFIGHRSKDTLIGNDHMERLVSELKSSGNKKIHFLVIDDTSAPHSKLTTNREIQKGVNAFFKHYGFPYNKTHV